MLDVMIQNMKRAESAKQERILDEAQELVDAGVRLRDITILGDGEFRGRIVVTKADAALRQQLWNKANSISPPPPRAS